MKFSDLRDYFALKPYLKKPWAFVRSRKSALDGDTLEVPFKQGFTLKLRRFQTDRQVINDIFARDEYRLNQFASGQLGTVINIGAHIGVFDARVSMLAKRVISFEPVPANYEGLRRNLADPRFSNVLAVPKAVAGKRGMLEIFLSNDPGGHSILGGGCGGAAPIKVEAVTLSDVFADYSVDRCDLLKLDCEGAEYEILENVPDSIWPKIMRIFMEYHAGPPGWNALRLAGFLKDRGYYCDLVPRKSHADMGHMFATRPQV